jgi:hypothetical protein
MRSRSASRRQFCDWPFYFMKRTHLSLVLAGFVLSLLTVWWCRAQTASQPLTVMVNGMEVHTLSLDQQNALVALLAATGQTNSIEQFRQYRCSARADQASLELGETLAILQDLRRDKKDEAIYLLEQQLSRNAGLLCNSYGGLDPTNRARVGLKSLAQTRDYFATFPHPEWGTNTATAMNDVLRLSHEQQRK